MAKEQVIVFEGEHNFVAQKNHVVNRKTGMVHYVPSEMNVVAPIDDVRIDQPIDQPKQPDDPMPSPITTTTSGSPLPSIGSGGGSPMPTLGDPTALSKPQEEVTPAPAPQKATIPTLPISFGAAPIGGGGGGGKKDEASAKKTFLQKYWWLLLIATAIGGYAYYKRKK